MLAKSDPGPSQNEELSPRDKVAMWKSAKNYYDLKAEDQMLEIKMNRVVEAVGSPDSHNSTTSSTSSFFERQKNRSMQSDQTSVMDAQHGPGAQLKFAVFSLLLFSVVCLLAALLVILSSNSSSSTSISGKTMRSEQLIQTLLAYSLSILVLMLSVAELLFYVVSRDDLQLCRCSNFKV